MNGASLKSVEVTQTRVYCHRPLGGRVVVGLISLAMGAMCLYLLGFFWPTRAGLAERLPAEVVTQLGQALVVPLLGLCVPTSLFLYYAGPADLVVDTDRRTYRFRRGFPLLASWREGTLDDVAGLRVGSIGSRSGSAYQTTLEWKNTRATPWTLGNGPVADRRPFQVSTSRDQDTLLRGTRELAARMGVPLMESEPPWEQARRRAVSLAVLVPVVALLLCSGVLPLIVSHTLASQGRETPGVVSGLRHGKGYTVRYAYRAGGRPFEGRASVDGQTYEGLDVGGPVTVRYLPSHPHTSTLEGSRDATGDSAVLVACSVLVAVVVGASQSRRPGR